MWNVEEEDMKRLCADSMVSVCGRFELCVECGMLKLCVE